MAINFTELADDQVDFGKPREIQILSARIEAVQSRVETGDGRRRDARLADSRWVFCMDAIAGFGEELAILALSDGVTCHMVTACRVEKGVDDYLVIIADPWGPELGSFLQEGRNVAGCAAQLSADGYWAIPAGQLWRVLDSATIIGPKDDHGAADDVSEDSNSPS